MYLPAVYIKAETRRKENSMKNMETNFHEQRLFRSDFSLKHETGILSRSMSATVISNT